jgi:hypothetical protein
MHYERLQDVAEAPGPAGEYARLALASLGVGLTASIKVEPAKYERAKWVVIAE